MAKVEGGYMNGADFLRQEFFISSDRALREVKVSCDIDEVVRLLDKYASVLSAADKSIRYYQGEKKAELKLRYLLWIRHDSNHSAFLYGDDGEMQCSKCGIDFLRMPVDGIERTWTSKATQMWLELQKQPKEGEKSL
jgi:hypothetical protein